ncbi:MAG: RloB family protein [Micrococcales bacterium]|nr:RloB family protein [Micrococcales bacterium]
MGRRRALGDPRSTRRAVGTRTPHARVAIVVGGTVTEPRYFNEVKGWFPKVNLTVVAHGRHPEDLVARARKLVSDDAAQAQDHKDRDNRLDRVYVVTDVDDFTPQLLRLRSDPRALDGVDLVISNPCFEVWLVCHKTRPDHDRRRVQQQAKDLGLVTGHNGKDPVLAELTNVAQAEQMARQLRVEHERNSASFPADAPSTRVDEIIAYMRGADDRRNG